MRLFLVLMTLCVTAHAAPQTMFGLAYPYTSDSNPNPVNVNSSGQLTMTLQAGEDQTNNVMRVEGQFTPCVDDADIVCKATAGFVHSINCYPEDAAAEAGRVRLLNHTAAGGGVEIWGTEFAAAAYAPQGAVLDVVMSAGVVIDFTTTTDVFCVVSYR